MKNYYKVLGVPPDASIDEVDKAYEVLSHQYDPEKNKGDKYAEERFIDIAIAYKTLSDSEKRNDYDKILAEIQPGAGTSGRQQGYPAQNTRSKSRLPFILLGGVIVIAIAFWVINNNKQTDTREAVIPPLDSPALELSTVAEPDTLAATMPVADTVTKTPVKEPANAGPEAVEKKERQMVRKSAPKPAQDMSQQRPAVAEEAPQGLYIGAGKKHVLDKQGTPTSIVRYENNSEMWYYGKSSIYFAGNKVSAYKNIDNNLKIAEQR